MPQTLETQIDRFVNEVTKNGKLTFSQAAKLLGISIEQVEEWALILDKNKEETNIEVLYPTTGEPLILTTPQKKKGDLKEKTTELIEEGDELAKVLELSEQKAKEVSKTPLPTKTEIKDAVGSLKEKIKVLKTVESDFVALKREIVDVEDALHKTEVEEQELITKAEAARKNLEGVRVGLDDLVTALADKLANAERVQAHLDELTQVKADTPKNLKILEGQVKNLGTDLARLDKQAESLNPSRMKSKIRKLLGKAN